MDRFGQQLEIVRQRTAALYQHLRAASPQHHPQLLAAYDELCTTLNELDTAKDDLLRSIVERTRVEQALRESEARFRSLVQNSSDVITVLGADGTIIYESASIERILGYKADALIGKSAFALIHPDDLPAVLKVFNIGLQTPGTPLHAEYRFQHHDGSWRYVESIGANLLDVPTISGVVINSRDVTDRTHTEQALRESEERFRQLAENIREVFWMTDVEKNQVIYVSPAYEQMWGYTTQSLYQSATSFLDAIHPDDRPRILAALEDQRREVYNEEYRIVRPSGEIRWIWDRAFPIRNQHGEIYRTAGIAEDITERKQTEAQLLHHAMHDVLTGLPNRALFMNHLEHALARTKRYNSYAFAVLFCDLDRFKQINDSLGHLVGDQVLIGTAHRLEACLRPNDIVARLGGDEFVIFLDAINDIGEVTDIAHRIQQSLSVPFHVNGHELVTTTSIGVVMNTTMEYASPQDLLRDSNIAMYRAKALGKARHVVFDQTMYAHAVAVFQMEADLRHAIERQEFRLHYQPIVSLTSGTIVGAEALLRWEHPQRGLVLPTTFIQLAEETGLIHHIGEWVLRTACAQTKAWHAVQHVPLFVTVNLSARQFQHADLSTLIGHILEETGLDSEYLKLELTESSLMDHPEVTAATLQQLRMTGSHLLIDDFGTGYSSLSRLKLYPIDTLKIDQSFVRGIATNSNDAAIITATIAMAHSLNLTVIAEGVETEQQRAFLRQHQCDMIQGNLIGQPMQPGTLTPLLQHGLLPATMAGSNDASHGS
jgi:diguanylate cyclase (GGDEF)-like protein/PAS domain S-box-containing protein